MSWWNYKIFSKPHKYSKQVSPNTKFIFEFGKNNKINLLDVRMKNPNNSEFETFVYQKSRNIDTYINWNAHVPTECKIGTLTNLTKQKLYVLMKLNWIKKWKILRKCSSISMNQFINQKLNDNQTEHKTPGLMKLPIMFN